MRRLAAIVFVLLSCSRPLPKGSVRSVVDRSHDGKRVLFIGLDGVDWRMVDRTMPRLSALSREGDRRVLMTQHPPLSPLVWTTMMTGVSPLEHRILDFARFNPVTREKELITSDERAAPAIWNMATYGGKRVGVFGMWATEPPEEVNGIIVPYAHADIEDVYRSARDWISREKPDLAVVYFQGTDEIGHLTGGDVEKARGYFRRMDDIVADLIHLEEAEVIIASDHGFDWGGHHAVSSTDVATAAQWHRDEGMFLHLNGAPPPSAAVAAEGRGAPPNVQQICATLLAFLGLPRDEHLAHSIIADSNRDTVDYRRYFHRQRTTDNRQQDREAIARLKALGYIAANEPSHAPANATSTRTPASFNNEGLILAERKNFDAALAAYEQALAIDPNYVSAKTNGDHAHLYRGRYRLEARDCSGAVTDFQAIRTRSALAWASIAAAEGCLGHEAAAESAARKSLALDPNQPALRALLR
jgi:tetratricopeptide (TPR) repeat protein